MNVTLDPRFLERLKAGAARAAFEVLLILGLLAMARVVASAQTPAATSPLVISLGDAARLAGKQGATAEVARARAEQAQSRVTQQRSALLPNVSAIASDNQHTINSASFGFNFPAPAGSPPLLDPDGQIIGPVNNLDARARVTQTLLDLSARARVRTARAQAQAALADASSASDVAAAGAAAAYLRVLRAEGQLSARAADSANAAELIRIAQEQLRAGVGVGLDVTRAQSQSAAIRAQLISARNERDRARLELLRALNLPLDTQLQLRDTLSSAPISELTTVEGDAVARALRSRPDLRAAQEAINASRQGIAAVKAERMPIIGAYADDGLNAKPGGNVLNTYNWGIQVSLPIFEGGRRDGRVQEQEAQLRELEVRQRDLQQQVSIEVRGALLDLTSASEQVDAARERTRLAEQELSQARERFRAGVAGNADVVTASIGLNAARTQLVDALTSYQTARVLLARAEGALGELR